MVKDLGGNGGGGFSLLINNKTHYTQRNLEDCLLQSRRLGRVILKTIASQNLFKELTCQVHCNICPDPCLPSQLSVTKKLHTQSN